MYVDDLIPIGNNKSIINTFTNRIHREFAIKDYGDLSYFLRLEVSYTYDGLFLSQSKYAIDIMKHSDHMDSRLVPTPLTTNQVLTSHGSLLKDISLYHSLVGALK